MAKSGRARHRITFDKRVEQDDGFGNTQAGWEEQFTLWAEVKVKLGGEAVTAARLQSQNTVNLTIRQSRRARLIREDWRARDQSEGVEYAIKSIIDPDDGGAWLEILCQTGTAA
jgi:SPP1 family predicted phage head-tail adaptor